jgi:hypothetical protein
VTFQALLTGGASVPITLAYIGSASTTGDATNYSAAPFDTLSIGASPAGGTRRYVVLCIGGAAATATDTRHVTGGSAGGVAGTLIAENNNQGTACGIVLVADPAGTTGVVLNFDAGMTCAGVSVYTLTVPSTATVTAAVAQEDSGDPLDWTVPFVSAGGVIIAVSQNQEGGTEDHTATWTELTENFDADINSDEFFSTASKAYAAAASGVAIQCDVTGSPDRHVGIAVAFNAA